MNRKGVVILSAFAIVSVLLVIVITFFAQHSSRSLDSLDRNNVVVGTIASVRGQVEARASQTLEFKPALAHQDLHSQEVVRTDRNSEAVVELKSGTNLHVGEASRFVVEPDATRQGALIGTILEGQVAVLKSGDAKKLRLYYEGREVPLDENLAPGPAIVRPARVIRSTGITLSATTPNESANPAPVAEAGDSAPDAADSNLLTNEDIVRQLRGQTGFFQRCYLGFVQRIRGSGEGGRSNRKMSGTIVLGFRVLPSGKLSDVKVVRTDFGDETLENCLTEVVERARFKAFDGDAVPVLEFPITLN